MRVERLGSGPIITPETHPSVGRNINGPSLVRVPDWVTSRLGRYYLYFAAHRGSFIRLAYSDALTGPWRIFEPGALRLSASGFCDHIASPDVHLDDRRREFRMYFHGVVEDGVQASRIALSSDGLAFIPRSEVLGPAYLRAFPWDGCWYAIAMPGMVLRSRDGFEPFEPGTALLPSDSRHCAVWVDNAQLHVVYSRIGDCPERLLISRVSIRGDCKTWRAGDTDVLLEPELPYEGADLSFAHSVMGEAPERRRELRDPAIYREDEDTYLLYSVAGESGIGIARVGR